MTGRFAAVVAMIGSALGTIVNGSSDPSVPAQWADVPKFDLAGTLAYT